MNIRKLAYISLSLLMPMIALLIPATAIASPTVYAAPDATLAVNTPDNAATATSAITAVPDLRIDKFDFSDPVNVGSVYTYGLHIHNDGFSATEFVTITDQMPGNVIGFPIVNSGDWTCQAGNIDIENTTVIRLADLAIEKRATPDPIEPVSILTYVITVTNNGPYTATGVLITDTVPSGLIVNEVDTTGWTCAPQIGVDFICGLGIALAPSDVASLTITTTVPLTGVLANLVVVTAQTSLGADVTAIATTAVTLAPHTVFLPILFNQHLFASDFVVADVTVVANEITVIYDPFWVDVYLNPNPVPTAVNQTWDTLDVDGGWSWGVEGVGLPLLPGQSLTLTMGGVYYEVGNLEFKKIIRQ